MSRSVGAVSAIQDLLGEPFAVGFAVLFAFLTQLGDIWFVTLLLAGAFLRFDRDRILTVGGLVIGGIALVLACKYAFALPRPGDPLVALGAIPSSLQPLYAATAYATGYGFPSGHAAVTTVTYLSLARVVSVGTRRWRYAGTAVLIALVSLSRVVLGVHYLVDVLAGIALGVGFLLIAWRVLARYPDEQPTASLGIATALAAVSVAASGVHIDAVLLFVAAGAVFGLHWTVDRPRSVGA